MKIVHRINLDVAGGVENQLLAFLQHPLAKAPVRHDLIYASGIVTSLAAEIRPHIDHAKSYKRWRGVKLPRRPQRLREARMAALVEASAADVLLSWSGFAREALVVAARQTKTPLVYREGGGAWFEHDPDAAERFMKEMRGAICNTHASMRMLQLKWGYSGPAKVCMGGIRPSVMAAADESGRTAAGGERKRIGVAARLASEKGVCLALHTLKHLRHAGLDCVLDIAGDGPDRAGLESLAADLAVEDSVRFRGLVRDMPAFYRSLDLLLHPALQEPLGNVTIEAQAFGVPVVAARVDGMAETILEDQTGRTVAADQPYNRYPKFGGARSVMQSARVYDPDTDALRPVDFVHPQALADAIIDILGDAGRAQAMSEAARAHAREAFSFDRYMAGFMHSIKEYAATE